MKNLILFSKNAGRFYHVRDNGEGVVISMTIDGEPVWNMSGMISGYGGAESMLARCFYSEKSARQLQVEYDAEKAAEKAARKAAGAAEKAARLASIRQAYADMVGQYDVIPATRDNIRTLLRYMNEVPSWKWSFPRMHVEYSMNQYDCDGQIATTIILSTPVDGGTRFVYGAPRGHLTKYERL